MPAIVCPQPRSPHLPKLLLSPPPFYVPPTATQLRSPIHFPEPCPRTPKPLLTPKRRRHKGSRRRRPLSRVDYRFDAPRSPHPLPHIFDSLPWIAALEETPEHVRPCDLADLSLLPDASSPGPVRRRRSSPKSSPILLRASDDNSEYGAPRLPLFLLPREGSTPSDTTTTAPVPLPAFSPSSTPAPPLSPLSPRPHTPCSRFDPSRVIFRNLMPISLDPRQDRSDCIHN